MKNSYICINKMRKQAFSKSSTQIFFFFWNHSNSNLLMWRCILFYLQEILWFNYKYIFFSSPHPPPQFPGSSFQIEMKRDLHKETVTDKKKHYEKRRQDIIKTKKNWENRIWISIKFIFFFHDKHFILNFIKLTYFVMLFSNIFT